MNAAAASVIALVCVFISAGPEDETSAFRTYRHRLNCMWTLLLTGQRAAAKCVGSNVAPKEYPQGWCTPCPRIIRSATLPVCDTKPSVRRCLGWHSLVEDVWVLCSVCMGRRSMCLRRAVKVSREINLGLDVGLELGLGSPTQRCEYLQQHVFYNETLYFLFGVTME